MKIIDDVRTYGSEAEAFRRVLALQKDAGICPGIVHDVPDGKKLRWRLTHDPDISRPLGPKAEVEDKPVEYVESRESDSWYDQQAEALEYELSHQDKKHMMAA